MMPLPGVKPAKAGSQLGEQRARVVAAREARAAERARRQAAEALRAAICGGLARQRLRRAWTAACEAALEAPESERVDVASGLVRPWLALRRLGSAGVAAHAALAARVFVAVADALAAGHYAPRPGGAFGRQAPRVVESAAEVLCTRDAKGWAARTAARALIVLTDARQWDGGASGGEEAALLAWVGARSSVPARAAAALTAACGDDDELAELRLMTLGGVALRAAARSGLPEASRRAAALLTAVPAHHLIERAPAALCAAMHAPAALAALAKGAPAAAAASASAAGAGIPSAALRAAACLVGTAAAGRLPTVCVSPLTSLLQAALMEVTLCKDVSEEVTRASSAVVEALSAPAAVAHAFEVDSHDACGLYDALLALVENLPSSQPKSGDKAGDVAARLLNKVLVALAFSQSAVRASWQVSCATLAMDTELAAYAAAEPEQQAIKRLTPPAARGGFAAASAAGAAASLNVFCRALAVLLAVLEDAELNGEREGCPLSPGAVRAAAATLNTMAYFSVMTRQFVDDGGSGAMSGGGALYHAGVRCLLQLRTAACRSPALRSGPAGALGPPLLWLAPAALAPPERYGPWAEDAVLSSLPHTLPFPRRVAALRRFVDADRTAHGAPNPDTRDAEPGALHRAAVHYEVRRDRLVEDGLCAFRALMRSRAVLPLAPSVAQSVGGGLRNPLNIVFVNVAGAREAGLDFGGLYKEFLSDMAAALCQKGHYGLWAESAGGLAHPSREALSGDRQADAEALTLYELGGQVLSKCLYEGVLVDAAFSPAFCAQILQGTSHVGIEDLKTLDSEIYKSLMAVKHYTGDLSDLALDFTVEIERFGAREAVELVPGGAAMDVCNSNRLAYCHHVADFHLNRATATQRAAFCRGLSTLMRPAWLKMFSPTELNLLTGGAVVDVDVDALESVTHYSGGYSRSSRTVRTFWRVVRQMSQADKQKLLKFVTSSSRPPALGFAHLRPPFTVHKVACESAALAIIGLGKDVERLPSASTCFNMLKLPNFKREGTMRDKVLTAIRSNAGFDLS